MIKMDSKIFMKKLKNYVFIPIFQFQQKKRKISSKLNAFSTNQQGQAT